jgi:hypothetical protein
VINPVDECVLATVLDAVRTQLDDALAAAEQGCANVDRDDARTGQAD